MENSDVVTKSVLKQSDSVTLNKIKKVSFCNTVRVFIEESCNDSKIDEEPHMKCVEISIVDKSNDCSINVSDLSNDDCNASDFLVHKVIYDNCSVSDEDTDLEVQNEECEENHVLFEPNADDDNLEFVVHKVTDHEDDLIQQESEFESCTENVDSPSKSTMDFENDIARKLSELSVENILVHDRIIAIIDQKGLNFPSEIHRTVSKTEQTSTFTFKKRVSQENNSCLKSAEELVLSPPLQELSLEKIVKAQSDNALCELDISPLNSIQETDTESDVSSEGTMIMMTSEECQKNEQHIRESLLHYQAMKEKAIKSSNVELYKNSENLDKTEGKIDVVETVKETTSNESIAINGFSDKNDSVISLSSGNLKNVITSSENSSMLSLSDINVKFLEPNEELSEHRKVRKQRSCSVPDTILSSNSIQSSLKSLNPLKRISLSTPNNAASWDKSLEAVEIPKDVREWKILLNSVDEEGRTQMLSNRAGVQSEQVLRESRKLKIYNDFSHSVSPVDNSHQIGNSDELEHFVHESTERVERIRNRYLSSNRSQMKLGFIQNSVRGIRPRFGSTAEILQLMQEQNQPFHFNFSVNNHLSWPCEETITSSRIKNAAQSSYFCDNNSLSGEYPQSSFSSFCEGQLDTNFCDHYSISSCPSSFYHERGAPEGASPPHSLSDNTSEHFSIDDNSNSYVYYSMKV